MPCTKFRIRLPRKKGTSLPSAGMKTREANPRQQMIRIEKPIKM